MAKYEPQSKCSAHAKSSGKPCGRPAIPGGSVCRFHGGSAPQVRKAALARLAALVDPSISVIHSTLKNKKRPDLALTAARDVLDRNGFKATDKLELSGPDGEGIKLDLTGFSESELAILESLIGKASAGSGEAAATEESN